MVQVMRYPNNEDWKRCKTLAMNTIGKVFVGDTVTDEWKERILQAEHSPIRTLMFTVKMIIPYYVSVHFCRHKYGVEHFVTTQRNDRQDMYDRTQAPQGAEVCHIMDLNAQALINLAHKRLCGNADPATREVMQQIVSAVCEVSPEMKPVLVPLCEYRGGVCHDYTSCGRCKNG